MRIHETDVAEELRDQSGSGSASPALSASALEMFNLLDALFGLEAVTEESADLEFPP